MKTDNKQQTKWQEMLTQLPWSPKNAQHSAAVALSKAEWLGIDKNEAIQAVLEVAVSTHLQENRHVLFATWQEISASNAAPLGSRFGTALSELAA